MAIVGANTAETLIRGIGSFWTQHFKGQDVLETLYQAAETNIAQTYLDIVSVLTHTAIDSTTVLDTDLWKLLDLKVEDFTLDAGTGEWRVPHGTDLADVRFLQDRIMYSTVTYELGYDFWVDRTTSELVFTPNIHSPIATGVPYYEDADGKLHLLLWAQDAKVETYALYEKFGRFLTLAKDLSTEDYRTLITGIMSLFVKGPTLAMMESALNVIAGMPINTLPGGVVLSVDPAWPGGTLIVVDRAATDTLNPEQMSYVLPFGVPLAPAIVPTYVMAESEAFSAVFTVTDYVETPLWWEDNYIPHVMARTLSLAERRSRSAYYAQIYADSHEEISAWTDTGATDFGALGVLAGDILWIGEVGFEEPFTITEVGPYDHVLRFTPNLDEDYISDGRFSIGSMGDPILRKAVATDGRSLRVGGMFYGVPDADYGGLWSHNLAWNLWFYLLKYHVFMILFDDNVVTTENMTFLVDTVYHGKPVHTLPVIIPWSEFSDTVVADDGTVEITATLFLNDTATGVDNTLLYGDDETYNEPLVYYGMMDRDYSVGAEAGPPATSPAVAEAVYSGTIVASYTDLMPYDHDYTYPATDGVISEASAVLDGWTYTNNGELTTLKDFTTGTDRLEIVTAASANNFDHSTRTSPYLYELIDNPMSMQIKIDSSSIGADSGVGLVFLDPADNANWSGAIGYEKTGTIQVEARDTVADVTSVHATEILGAVTSWWVKVERTYEDHDTFTVYTKAADGDPWTNMNSEVNAAIGVDTQIALVVINPSGNAGTIDLLDLEMTVRVS
jgi:hypothetical protein